LDGGARPSVGFAPDPEGLTTRHQWLLDLRFDSGVVALAGTRRVELAQAQKTPRVFGRFAVELYVGTELLDRVRFDFPLLGAGELPADVRPWEGPPSFARRLRSSTAVMVPHSERATRAVLVDRASGRVMPLPWPFDASREARTPISDAGAPPPETLGGKRPGSGGD
jgi:hypothetical protein